MNGFGDILNEGMGVYSVDLFTPIGEGNGNPLRILARRIPWTEEPGRLQSMGSQRVGHD